MYRKKIFIGFGTIGGFRYPWGRALGLYSLWINGATVDRENDGLNFEQHIQVEKSNRLYILEDIQSYILEEKNGLKVENYWH